MRLLVVGMSGWTSVGESLARAGKELGHEVTFLDASAAYDAPKWARRLTWHVLDHRPPKLRSFQKRVLQAAGELRPSIVIATGQMPITAVTLQALRGLGAQTANVSTDDPWNRNSRSARSLRALASYDAVYTPRRANVKELEALGGPVVHYLPFAYDPLHCLGPDLTPDERALYACDLLFVGGADPDRAAILQPCIEAGLDVHLYGAHWNRYQWATRANKGQASPDVLRKATRGASVSLCLVRRSNRDGHVMRTFEMAATGACLLVEWTEEHEAIFGPDGDHVVYFRSTAELLDHARALAGDPERCQRLANRVADLIRTGGNEYRDRMRTILSNV